MNCFILEYEYDMKQCYALVLEYDRICELERPRKFWCIHSLSYHRKHGCKVLLSSHELHKIALETDYCNMCGIKLDWGRFMGKGPSNSSPSLDRIDNGEIISAETSWIICQSCNRRKSNSSMREFVQYCKMVSEKFA